MAADVDPDHRLELTALDVPVDVVLGGARADELVTLARAAWTRCRRDDQHGAERPDPAEVRVVLDDDEGVVHQARLDGALAGSDPAQLLDNLSPRVTVAAIERQAGELVMLHACGIADPATGRTVVLVAPSGTGKTTSSRLLGRRWSYVTDETVGIRADRTIASYPKPLSVITEGEAFKVQVSPDDLGLGTAPARASVHRLAILERDASLPIRVEPVSTVRALALLAPETSYLSRLTSPLQRLAGIVEACGGLRVLHYGEAEHLVEVVESFLGEDAP